MADLKISELTNLTAADPANDMIPIVDVSATPPASGSTKRISINNILACSPSATLASATISGDLTVDTSTLKVDSANNRVGIGTASPAFTLDVQATVAGAVYGSVANNDTGGSGSARFRVFNSGDVSDGFAIINNYGAAGQINLLNYKASSLALWTNSVERFTISSTGVATWSNVGGSSGTAMTLNSTGLGVGVASPAYKIHSAVTSGFAGAFRSSTAVAGGILCGNSLADLVVGVDASGNGRLTADTSKYLGLGSGGINDRVILDTSGNFGIGVTPSAKLHINGDFRVEQATTPVIDFYTSTTKRALIKGTSSELNINSLTSNPITFTIDTTEQMRLDASGNLLVGKTANYGTGETQTLQLKSSVIFGSDNTGSASNRNWSIGTNASAAGSMEWTVSSTNTGWPNFAYRMQLTSAGAAYNTTGTWGTISDSRLKENISDARNYLADLLKLRVVKYSLKEEASAVATKLGLIAQEVEQVFPSLVEQSDVAYDGGDGIRTVKTSILVPMLLKAIQELTARVQTIETR